MQAVTWLTITGAFVLGMVLALLGSIKLSLARRLDIGETRIGGLVAAFHFALIPMMPLSGLLIDLWGVQVVLMLGCLVTAVALIGLTLPRKYGWAVCVVLVLGSGVAFLSTSTIVLMPRAFGPFFHADDSVTASLNLGNVFFALGALVTPTLAEVLLTTFDFRRTLLALAALCLLPALFIPFTDTVQGHGDLATVLRDPSLWIAGVLFALYVPIEFCLATWGTTYLLSLGNSERRAAWLLSGFWLTFLAGRVLMAYLYSGPLGTGSETWLLVIMALFVAAALGNLLGAVDRHRAALGLLLLGFLLGPIFPTLIGVLFHRFEHARGTAYGAMFAIGSLGSFLLGPVMGRQAKRQTMQQVLRIPLGLAVLLTLAALVLALALV